MTSKKPNENRPASRRTLAAATNPTRKAIEAATALSVSHPAEYADALRLVAALAQPHQNGDEVAAYAAVIVAPLVTDPDRPADWRKACRAAVKRAAAAIARSTLSPDAAQPMDPADLTDDSRAALVHYAPDPQKADATSPADYTAATLARLPRTPDRAALVEALDRARAEGVPYTRTTTPRAAQRAALTCREDGARWRSRVAAAVKTARTVEADALADPWQDGTARQPLDWTHPAPRTGSPLPPAAAPTADTLATLRHRAALAAAARDWHRVQVALAPADQHAAACRALANADRQAVRAAAALAAAETHADRTARRTGVAPAGLPQYDADALSPRTPTRTPVAPKDRPAQVPRWQTTGGTARPLVGAVVALRTFDTGTPGVELQRVRVTAPDGTVWVDRWTPTPLAPADATALSTALAAEADTAADALALVERRLVAPPLGKPKEPSRKPSRVGNTGPTVSGAAVGMTR